MCACLSVGVTSLCVDEFGGGAVGVGVRLCMYDFVCLGMFECAYLCRL